MKTPYTIQSWKAGKKAVTREGLEILQLDLSEDEPAYPLDARIAGLGWYSFTSNGRFLNNHQSHRYDLFEKED